MVMGYTVLGYLPPILTPVPVHRHRRHALAHVPRQRDGDLVLRRPRPVGLAARRCSRFAWPVLLVVAVLALVGLALGQPADPGAEGPLRQPRRPRARRARPVPGVGQRHAACSSWTRTRRTTSRASNIFISTDRARQGNRHLGAQRPHRDRGRRPVPAAVRTASGWRTRSTGDGLQDQRVRGATAPASATASSAARRRARRPRRRSTLTLLREPTRANQGELAWRLGLALAALNFVLLALTVSSVNPRVGPQRQPGVRAVRLRRLLQPAEPGPELDRHGPRRLRRLHAGCCTAAPCCWPSLLAGQAAQQLGPARPLLRQRCGERRTHEDHPPPDLRRGAAGRGLRGRWASWRCSSSSTSSTSCPTSARRGSPGYRLTQALRLRDAADAQPPVRAAADRGADRHHLRDGAAGAELRIHHPAHQRPGPLAGAAHAAGAGAGLHPAHLRRRATTWRPLADRTAQLLKARYAGRASRIGQHRRLAEGAAAHHSYNVNVRRADARRRHAGRAHLRGRRRAASWCRITQAAAGPLRRRAPGCCRTSSAASSARAAPAAPRVERTKLPHAALAHRDHAARWCRWRCSSPTA